VFALLLNEDIYEEEDIGAEVISALEKLDPDFAHTLATPPSDEHGRLLLGMIHLWRALQFDPTDDSGELKKELQSAVKANIRFAKDVGAYLNAHIQNRSLFDVVLSQNMPLTISLYRPIQSRDYQDIHLFESLSPLMNAYKDKKEFVIRELTLQPVSSDDLHFVLLPGGTVLAQAGGIEPVVVQQDIALVACKDAPSAAGGAYPITMAASLQENAVYTLSPPNPDWTDALSRLAPLWRTPAKDNSSAQEYQWAIWTLMNDNTEIIKKIKEHDIWEEETSLRNLPTEITEMLDSTEIQEILDEELVAYLEEIRRRSTDLLNVKNTNASS
jgi:hypothetical protein